MSDSKIEEGADLLSQRYGNQDIPTNIIWNKNIELMLSHRSIRNFLSDPLPEGAIETMVAAAQSASISGNLQQWSVIAITDKDLKARIGSITRLKDGAEGNYYIEQAPVLLLWVADLSRNNHIAKARGGKAEIHNYLDSFLMSSIDTALASQNAALAAESIGLGIVYIGALRNQAEEIAEALRLPEYSYVTFGMVVGWPDHRYKGRIRPRLAQDVVLHFNGYDSNIPLSKIDDYEADFKIFREESGMSDKSWQDSVSNAADSFGYMGGRENLRDAVEKQGFLLK